MRHGVWTSAIVGAIIGSYVAGCNVTQLNESTWLRETITQVPALSKYTDLIVDSIGEHGRDQIISIDASPSWQNVKVRVRYVIGDEVHCYQVIWGISSANSRERVYQSREILYSVRLDEAALAFRKLHMLVSMGNQYRGKSWDNTDDRVGQYLIAMGRVRGITTNEGGSCIGEICEACRWRSELLLGEQILDANLAESFFDSDACTSLAVLVQLAVDEFDTLAIVSSKAR